MSDALNRAREMLERSQDQQERARFAVAEQLWRAEEALSNRVRIFAVGVLAAAWALLLEPKGFDLRLVFASAGLAMVALVLDFLYFVFRRSALAAAYNRSAHAIEGFGPYALMMRTTGIARALVFFAAAGALVVAAALAVLPRLGGAG